MKKKTLIVMMLLLLMTGSVQAAVGEKITVQLQTQAINCNGSELVKAVLQYKGVTYVPLRTCGNMLGVSVSYKDEKIYIGAAGSTAVKPGESITGEIEAKEVSAKLRKQQMVVNGQLGSAEMIDYNGIMYVPLREFGKLVDVSISYADGVVQIGDADSNK